MSLDTIRFIYFLQYIINDDDIKQIKDNIESLIYNILEKKLKFKIHETTFLEIIKKNGSVMTSRTINLEHNETKIILTIQIPENIPGHSDIIFHYNLPSIFKINEGNLTISSTI